MRTSSLQFYCLCVLSGLAFFLVNGSNAGEVPNSSTTRDLESRIINGERAPLRRYPYTASLQNGTFHGCGASLIAPDLILSAAHCLGHATRVVINPYDLSQPINKSEAFDIVEEFVHPWYMRSTENSYDFMIVKIDGTSALPPVRLNMVSNLPTATEQLTVMGWGYKTTNAKSIANILQCANVSYINNTQCEQISLKGNFFLGTFQGKIREDMFCAFGPHTDSCQGDSGGPIVIGGKNSSGDVQVGIISWGYGCAKANYPGVYARVSKGWDWIRATVCNTSDDPPAYFECDQGKVTFSPVPTAMPTSPTASPAPTGGPQAVTVVFEYDMFAEETGFQIKNAQTGEIILSEPTGTVMSQHVTTETIMLRGGAEYVLLVEDTFGDGFFGAATIYLGQEQSVERILVYFDGSTLGRKATIPFTVGEAFIIQVYPTEAPALPSFTPSSIPSAPTLSPSPTSLSMNIVLILTLDQFPNETGYRIESEDGEVVREMLPGAYDSRRRTIRKTLSVTAEKYYNLVLLDSSGDGLLTPVYIFLESVGDDRLLAFFDPTRDFFHFELSIQFQASRFGIRPLLGSLPPSLPPTTSSDNTTNMYPSVAPTTQNGTPISIVFNFPASNVGWSLRSEGKQAPIAAKLPFQPSPTEFVHVIQNDRPLWMEFFIYVNETDGNLDSTTGSYTILSGDEVLATGDHEFGAARSHYFCLGGIGNVPVTMFSKAASPDLISWDLHQIDVFGVFNQVYTDVSRLSAIGETTVVTFKVKEGELYQMQVDSNTSSESEHIMVGSVDPFKGRVLSPQTGMDYTFTTMDYFDKTEVSGDNFLRVEIDSLSSTSSNGYSGIRWILSAGEETTAYTATSRQDVPPEYFEIYLFGPDKPYELGVTNATEKIPLPLLNASAARSFMFTIYTGDDLLGGGNYRVYNGLRLIAWGTTTDGMSYHHHHTFTIEGATTGVVANSTGQQEGSTTKSASVAITAASLVTIPISALLLLSLSFIL